ncbi:MAG: hypothetical protein JXJ22_15600 [Bacteroidales bacterium]|nr:hypothetical protein [Bacteroidales bacterium]
MDYYNKLKKELKDILKHKETETIKVVSAKPLSPEEAIGTPDRTDFPIQKGKEVMIEADFRGSKGQAFTDMPGNFTGTVQDFLNMKLDNNFSRSIFIAGFNAVMRHFERTTGTIHCKDKEPKACAEQITTFIREKFGKVKIAFIGFQPAMIEQLSKSFEMRIVDLDKDNIGKQKFGLTIEAQEKTSEVLEWGDIILATGSTCVNGTITDFLNKKPVVFYGISAAGVAAAYGYERFCPCGK